MKEQSYNLFRDNKNIDRFNTSFKQCGCGRTISANKTSCKVCFETPAPVVASENAVPVSAAVEIKKPRKTKAKKEAEVFANEKYELTVEPKPKRTRTKKIVEVS